MPCPGPDTSYNIRFANVCNVCNIVDDSKSSEKLNQRVGGLNICRITITIRIIPREYEYLGKSLAEKSMTNVMSDENCFEKKKKKKQMFYYGSI